MLQAKLLCCSSLNKEYYEAKYLNKMIERKIKLEQRNFSKEYKLLLLGTGESGKSTFLKQMKIIHGTGFSEADKAIYVKSIRENVFNCTRAALQYLMVILNIKDDASEREWQKEKISALLKFATSDDVRTVDRKSRDDPKISMQAGQKAILSKINILTKELVNEAGAGGGGGSATTTEQLVSSQSLNDVFEQTKESELLQNNESTIIVNRIQKNLNLNTRKCVLLISQILQLFSYIANSSANTAAAASTAGAVVTGGGAKPSIKKSIDHGVDASRNGLGASLKMFDAADVDAVSEKMASYLLLFKELLNFLVKQNEFKNFIDNFATLQKSALLPDSSVYYLNAKNFTRILDEKYNPTEEDILKSRTATTGILEFMFKIKNVNFRIIDVGGQRSERKKWIHCFNNVTSIIFFSSVSEYDQTLAEDAAINRMRESLGLFAAILLYPAFQNTSFILFLNKIDLLEAKIKLIPLKGYFPEYLGVEGDLEEVKKFFCKMFSLCNQCPTRDIYTHFTCATDTRNIKFVFEAVKDTLFQSHLKAFSLV